MSSNADEEKGLIKKDGGENKTPVQISQNKADNQGQGNHPEDQKKEENKTKRSTFFDAFYDGVGTFLLICAIYYCKGDITKFVIGFWVILTIFGEYSGAHLNPAVTFGIYIYEHKFFEGLWKLVLYWIFQFGGAIGGAMVSRNFYKQPASFGLPKDNTLFDILFIESLFTGLFIFIILQVAVSPITGFKSKHTTYGIDNSAPFRSALIVGWFYLLVNAGFYISGAAFNPAVLSVINFLASESTDAGVMKYVCYMIAAEMAGALVFALLHKLMFETYIDSIHPERSEENTCDKAKEINNK
jgi:glycerol uptake facilitator-like aquaporin